MTNSCILEHRGGYKKDDTSHLRITCVIAERNLQDLRWARKGGVQNINSIYPNQQQTKDEKFWREDQMYLVCNNGFSSCSVLELKVFCFRFGRITFFKFCARFKLFFLVFFPSAISINRCSVRRSSLRSPEESHCVFPCPFSCQLSVLVPVSFKYSGDFWDKWIIGIWITQ